MKRYLITSGMSGDMFLFETNAPLGKVKEWCLNYIAELENGENTYLNSLKKEYYVNVLVDSEISWNASDEVEEIGYDVAIDLFNL